MDVNLWTKGNVPNVIITRTTDNLHLRFGSDLLIILNPEEAQDLVDQLQAYLPATVG